MQIGSTKNVGDEKVRAKRDGNFLIVPCLRCKSVFNGLLQCFLSYLNGW